MKTISLKALVCLFLTISWLYSPLLAEDDPAGVLNITNIEIVDENCDKANGSFTVTHDGTAPFLYFLNGVGTGSNVVTGLSAGSYTFKITDSNACEAETTMVVVGETFPPTLMLQSKINATCDTRGSASIVSSDPSATATWDSNPVQMGYDLLDVQSGIYTITAVDSFGCEASLAVTIDAPGQMVLAVSATPDTCTSGDGTATVAVQLNGVPPFSYAWGNKAGNQTTATATNLEPANYAVVVTDADGCEASTNVTVGLVENLAMTVDVTDASCFGRTDASVRLNVTGGNGSYVYKWTPNVSTTRSADSLQAGNYRVIVTDAEGTSCEITENIVVGEAPKINPVLVVGRASDCGVNDAKAFVSPRNVQGPYTVVWDTLDTNNAFQVGDTANNLYPGIYQYNIEDSVGCAVSGNFVVVSDNGFTIDIDILQEDDCGLGQGIARARVVGGGTHPFRYKWFTFPRQPNDREQFAYNLEQRTQLVVVKDTNDCVNLANFVMPGNPPLKVKNINTTPDFCELANGTGLATFEGGTPPYAYTWNTTPVQTSATATGLETGFYRVAIQDELGCRDTAQVYVAPKVGFDIATESEDIKCFGFNNGKASVEVMGGGTAPFTYVWNTTPPKIGKDISGLSEGTYTVVVTDAAGCQRNRSVVIENENPLVSAFTFEPDTINPLYLGSAVVTFKNLSENGHHYRWIFGDGNESYELDPTHRYVDTGTFKVSLFVFNEDETCSKLSERGPFRVLEKSGARVANAFTPNGDGFNDHLTFWGLLVEDFNISIYNRWGSEVFSSSSIEDGWDGNLKNGSPAPEGVYMYVLKSIGVDGRLTEDKGSITLIR